MYHNRRAALTNLEPETQILFSDEREERISTDEFARAVAHSKAISAAKTAGRRERASRIMEENTAQMVALEQAVLTLVREMRSR